MALDRYSSGASLKVLVDAVADLEVLGFNDDVRKVLEDTAMQRPRMKRYKPVGAGPSITPVRRPRWFSGHPRSTVG
jgi:hypothetical protein